MPRDESKNSAKPEAPGVSREAYEALHAEALARQPATKARNAALNKEARDGVKAAREAKAAAGRPVESKGRGNGPDGQSHGLRGGGR